MEEVAVRTGAHYTEAEQVRTFLLCTVPRLCQSGVRKLSKEIIQGIARWAYMPRYSPAFFRHSPQYNSLLAEGFTLSWNRDSLNIAMSNMVPLMLPPKIRHGLQYVEFEIQSPWYGTQVHIHKAIMEFAAADCFGIPGPREDIALVNDYHVAAWDGAWEWDEKATVGILVDMYRGYVALRLNDVNGPCVALGQNWFGGVQIGVSDLSDEQKENVVCITHGSSLPEGLHLVECGGGFSTKCSWTGGCACRGMTVDAWDHMFRAYPWAIRPSVAP